MAAKERKISIQIMKMKEKMPERTWI